MVKTERVKLRTSIYLLTTATHQLVKIREFYGPVTRRTILDDTVKLFYVIVITKKKLSGTPTSTKTSLSKYNFSPPLRSTARYAQYPKKQIGPSGYVLKIENRRFTLVCSCYDQNLKFGDFAFAVLTAKICVKMQAARLFFLFQVKLSQSRDPFTKRFPAHNLLCRPYL